MRTQFWVLLLLAFVSSACGKNEKEENAKIANVVASLPPKAGTMFSGPSRRCTTIKSILGVSFAFQYQVVSFTNGDRFVICSVSDRWGQYSASIYYKANQNGIEMASCTVGDDVDTVTSGYWSFSSSSDGTLATAVYYDIGSSQNGNTSVLSCSVVN